MRLGLSLGGTLLLALYSLAQYQHSLWAPAAYVSNLAMGA